MKNKDNKRFVKIHSEGVFGALEIWVDRKTGVNYLYRQSGYSGGLTVLVDAEGKPILSSAAETSEFSEK